MKKRVALVCKVEGKKCDGKEFKATAGGVETTYCCLKGFELALESFRKALKTNGRPELN